MSLGDYIHRDSPVHRLPAGLKLLILMAAGAAAFWLSSVAVLGGLLCLTLALYGLARIPLAVTLAQVRPILWILALIFVFQLATRDAEFAGAVVLRFVVLLLLASLVTLTTPASQMIDAVERRIGWMRYLGASPAKIGLGLSLAVRFVPVVAEITAQVREAQRARGLEWSILAVAFPVIIRTLQMSDDIANAIDARGYDP